MSVQRGIGAVLISVVGIIILLTSIVVIAAVLSSNAPVKPLIYKTIELRKATGAVDRANLISSLDDLVVQADNEDVKGQWDRMMSCLSTSCPDEAYLDMVLVVVGNFESDIPESALLVNVIATAKYWGSAENLLEFSKALSMANEQVDILGDKQVRKAWEGVIECNNVCPEKWNYYFDLIEAVVV